MAKPITGYHISHDGKTRPCRAVTPEKCKANKSFDQHFKTPEAAEKFIEKKEEEDFKKEHGDIFKKFGKNTYDIETTCIEWKDYKTPMGQKIILDASKPKPKIKKDDYIRMYGKTCNNEKIGTISYYYTDAIEIEYVYGEDDDEPRSEYLSKFTNKSSATEVLFHLKENTADDGLINSLETMGVYDVSNYSERYIGYGEKTFALNDEIRRKALDVVTTWRIMKEAENDQ